MKSSRHSCRFVKGLLYFCDLQYCRYKYGYRDNDIILDEEGEMDGGRK